MDEEVVAIYFYLSLSSYKETFKQVIYDPISPARKVLISTE